MTNKNTDSANKAIRDMFDVNTFSDRKKTQDLYNKELTALINFEMKYF
ncbi:MAG TPA: hypothetical protein PK200_12190 [Spirochaetota bacterium]|jgi:hypothetical protein|nr:hypothetical protein [Spirochaetota bacterium]HQO03615.1 hypothetical protein [Spirochaetota bacterium]HQP48520.1 hypothetical protein [Spirochaetota bacterium]